MKLDSSVIRGRRGLSPHPRVAIGTILLIELFALLATGCERARPARPSPASAALLPADDADAREAVAKARAALIDVGLQVPLVFRSARHLRLGALLPLRHRELPPDQGLRALLAPVRTRLRPLVDGCAPGGVCVVVVSELVPPSGAAAALLPELAGFALGPRALIPCDGAMAAVADAMGWPGCAGPSVVVLSARHLRQRDVSGRVALVMHEVGHALGLGHSGGGSDVMHPDAPMRAPPFTPAQLTSAREGIRALRPPRGR